MITLTPKHLFRIPIESECISPDVFLEKSLPEIKSLPLWEGNRKKTLGNLFRIEEKKDTEKETTIEIMGDVSRVRRIGTEMSRGKIIVKGDVGMHIGEEMKGGEIIVSGNSDSWVGSMMEGGEIVIKGNAGDYVGSSYRGASNMGMNGGSITINGSAGSNLGYFMRNGFIKVGNIGGYAGIHMKGGTILIQKDSLGRSGSQMTGGTIIVQGRIPNILPTFTIDSIRKTAKAKDERIEGPFYRFIGDLADHGKGRLYVSKSNNPHLKKYEKYL
jgi:formylmethanofuran dehydrogenase subunit C